MLAVTLHGPNYFAPNHDEHSIELFPNLQDAIEALLERHNANGHSTCKAQLLDGRLDDVFFPVFTEGHYFKCYELTCSDDLPLTEESVLEALTAVHNGPPDWELTLDMDDYGYTYIKVRQ